MDASQKIAIKFDKFLTIGIQLFCGARLKKSLQPLKIPVKNLPR